MKHLWLVLYAVRPLTAEADLRFLMQEYVRAGHQPFEMEVRTPAEYVSPDSKLLISGQSPAKALLFHYIFVRANSSSLDALLHQPNLGSPGIWMINQRTNRYSEQPLLARISTSEIDAFFRFCEAYTLFYQDRYLPFIDLTSDNMIPGDMVEVLDGSFAGLRARVIPAPQLAADQVMLLATWFGCVGVPMPFRMDQVRIVSRPGKGNPRYAPFDEFFAFLSQADAFERYSKGCPNGSDLAKAMRMVHTAHYDPAPQRHGERQSWNLRLLNVAALIASYHLLGERERVIEWIGYWHQLTDNRSIPKAYAHIQMLVATAIHLNDTHFS